LHQIGPHILDAAFLFGIGAEFGRSGEVWVKPYPLGLVNRRRPGDMQVGRRVSVWVPDQPEFSIAHCSPQISVPAIVSVLLCARWGSGEWHPMGGVDRSPVVAHVVALARRPVRLDAEGLVGVKLG